MTYNTHTRSERRTGKQHTRNAHDVIHENPTSAGRRIVSAPPRLPQRQRPPSPATVAPTIRLAKMSRVHTLDAHTQLRNRKRIPCAGRRIPTAPQLWPTMRACAGAPRLRLADAARRAKSILQRAVTERRASPSRRAPGLHCLPIIASPRHLAASRVRTATCASVRAAAPRNWWGHPTRTFHERAEKSLLPS